MPSEQPPRIKKWRNGWYIFYRDYTDFDSKGRPREKRISCNAQRARTREERRELLLRIRAEQKQAASRAELGEESVGLRSLLVNEIDAFLLDIDRRQAARITNPNARRGLAKSSAVRTCAVILEFRGWVAEHYPTLQTGRLSPGHLDEFVDHYAATPCKRGKDKVSRSAGTVNVGIRNTKTCILWIDDLEPPRFKDSRRFLKRLKPIPVNRKKPKVFSPSELTQSIGLLLEYEKRTHGKHISRTKNMKEETFYQTTASVSATSLSSLFLMLALTGARRGEVLSLMWKDVDMQNGQILFRASKTGRDRIIPIVGAPEGDIAPELFKLMQQWERDATTPYVIPTTKARNKRAGDDRIVTPWFPKNVWARVMKGCVSPITPQGLRHNFTSYAASLGIPASVAAMWQGHGAEVAERFYRTQLFKRNSEKSFEGAMGLTSLIIDLQRD